MCLNLYGSDKKKSYKAFNILWINSAKLDWNKKSLPKQKTIQNFIIDAQGFRKTKKMKILLQKNENPPTQKMGVTS